MAESTARDTVKPLNVPQPIPFRRRFNLRKADWLGYSQHKSSKILIKLMPHQNATRMLSELYVWRPERIYQEGVELTIFLVSQTKRRHYTKHTKNSIDVTH